MKRIFLLMITALCFSGISQAQQMQFTIKPSAVPYSVDVYMRPDYSSTFNYISNLSITVAYPSKTPAVTATITTGDVNQGIVWNTGLGATGTTEAGPAYAGYTFHTFTGLALGDPPINLVAGVEIKLATITFSSQSTNTAQVSLVSLDNIFGGASMQRYTYLEMSGVGGVIGPVSPDPTAGGVLFYSSAGLNTTGQFETASPFVRTTALISLPITLTSFDAVGVQCGSTLKWTVDQETNVRKYTIEYSSDGINYTAIGDMDPKGNQSTYNFTHNAAQKGNAFYRLKVTDISGYITYTSTAATKVNCNAGPSAQVYPTPVKRGEALTALLQQYSGNISASLYNAAGTRVMNRQFINGRNSMATSSLAAGMYMLVIADAAGNTSNHKIIVGQ